MSRPKEMTDRSVGTRIAPTASASRLDVNEAPAPLWLVAIMTGIDDNPFTLVLGASLQTSSAERLGLGRPLSGTRRLCPGTPCVPNRSIHGMDRANGRSPLRLEGV